MRIQEKGVASPRQNSKIAYSCQATDYGLLGGLNLTGLPEKDEHADAGGGGYRSAYYSSSSSSSGKIGGRSSSGSSSPLLEQRRAAEYKSPGHGGRWPSERRNYWKGEYNRYYGSGKLQSDNGLYIIDEPNLKRMKDGKPPIGTDGKPIILHHPYGIGTDMYYYEEMLSSIHWGPSYRDLHSFLYEK